jgi:hypothetical protein
VKGPKINPLDNTAMLGMKITGNKKFLLSERLESIRAMLTRVPTKSCGWPKRKGTKKAMNE